MARSRTTYNRTNKNTETPSARKARREARENGRGNNQSFTSGARSVMVSNDTANAMREYWNNNQNVETYTHTANGKMSVDGKTAGGSTWGFTQKDDEGNTIRQSGRSKMATRRQRYYDVRVGMGLVGG